MKIIKPLQIGLLHKSFTYLEQDVFAVSIPIAFSLLDGEIILEQKLWQIIGEQMGDDVFDAAMPKGRGEVLVQGDCITPADQAVRSTSVHLQLAQLDQQGHLHPQVDKELLVTGDRHWLTGGLAFSQPELFNRQAINYSHAYGGEDFANNPTGKGFKLTTTEQGQVHQLPNVEYIGDPVTSSSSQVKPASFGRVDVMWPQRLDRAGTYDDNYIAEQMPGFAKDIDWLYFNDAAEDQWLSDFFQGNEHYSITNMHPEYTELKGQLPDVYGRAFVKQIVPQAENEQAQAQFKEIETKLDTLWLFPNAAVGVMIYRGSIQGFSNDGCDIESLMVACESRAQAPRSLAHYEQEMAKRSSVEHGYKYALFTAPLIAEGMTCGFKQMQDEFDFPLEMLSKSNMDKFGETLHQQADDKLNDAKQQLLEQLKAAGVDPEPYLAKIEQPEKSPEQVKIEALLEKMAPGMVIDPDNIDLFNLDLSVMDELKQYLDQLRGDKEQQLKAMLNDKLNFMKQHEQADDMAGAIAQLESQIAEAELPPMWPRANFSAQLEAIKQQVADAEQQIEDLKKLGVEQDRLPVLDIDLSEMEQNLKQADIRVKEAYILGAHLIGESRSPHPQQEQQLKAQLLAKYHKGESLAGGDYACIDLQGENLSGIDLSDCYLEGVNFSNCDLTGANLQKAIAAGANFSGAKLVNTNCQGANLGATNLTSCQFSDCDLSQALLQGAKFEHTKLINCEMAEINFIESEFSNSQFDGSNLTQCNFISPKFSDCCFVQTNLRQANFVHAEFVQVDFGQSILSGANFVECQGSHVQFVAAEMINSRFVGGCDFTNADFSQANISKSCLRENTLNGCNFSHCTLDESDFSGALLSQSVFSNSVAYRTQFMKSHLNNADMSNMNLMEGSLYKAYLVGTDFSYSNLYCVNFMDATLGANRYLAANLDNTILQDWRP